MTHYTHDYSSLSGDAKREKALKDIEDYPAKAWFEHCFPEGIR